ncbi:MAG: hypothetical protein KatS3mg092_0417 [Patescibacteria group bacterium]|nr:MAG: hypothetical protein KatS3mg092_0417 [Patescibacteria group bacterium]
MNKLIFTTSWDDGYPLDKKLLSFLIKYNIKGTFYIPLQNKERQVMKRNYIKKIYSLGMEIGSHTLTHPILTKIDENQAQHELIESKKKLEEIIKKPVISFCYPKGKANPNLLNLVKKAGYKLARSTVLFHTNLKFDPFYAYYNSFFQTFLFVLFETTN